MGLELIQGQAWRTFLGVFVRVGTMKTLFVWPKGTTCRGAFAMSAAMGTNWFGSAELIRMWFEDVGYWPTEWSAN